ncbi:cobalt-precorrin-5B (C(1))-methyltransferase CbiD [Methanomethylophilus alvi]|uniref:cobalt-precorrin-5B (C(1))-methyltransferase CbiD n=1 Tax=Methanomethylophilus alvi TaxID=1291540 RepID=UPI0037DD5CF7
MGAIREEQGFVYVGGKRLRRGFTTGSCAAAASKAAVQMLLSGSRVEYVDLVTPKGIPIHVPVEDISVSPDSVSCAVRKDGGDDADDTNGALVYAKVSRKVSEGIEVDGGVGVGRVTRRGLDQPVGNAAINRVPRSMIKEAVEDVCGAYGHAGGISVEISVPEGERIAERTFNSRLGIVGGISILGTSGIVEPMSETALLGSIKAEMKVFMAPGRRYLLTVPGNYGKDFLASYPDLEGQQPVECSNFIGDFLDMAVELGAEGVLLVGNLGKLVKLAGGIMNTHSRNADSRMEILASNAVMAGADAETARRVMGCVSTDDALEVLSEKGLVGPTMDILIPKMEFHMNHRVKGALKVAAITFSSEFGVLGETPSARELLKKIEAGE